MTTLLRHASWSAPTLLAGIAAFTLSAGAMAADPAKNTPAAAPAAAAPATPASDIPNEFVYLAKDEAESVITTGKPGCAKGRMVVTYVAGTGFLEDGVTYTPEEVGFALGEAARAGKVSCLLVESAAYDRPMFLKMRDEYAMPNSVSLMWIPKSP